MPEEVTSNASGETPTSFSAQKLLPAAAIVAILASALWIYYFEFRTPDAKVPLHQSVGHALAEESSRVLDHRGNIVVVTMDTRNSPELKIQLAAFEKELKKLGGITI